MSENALAYIAVSVFFLLLSILLLIVSYRSVIIYRMIRDTPISKIRSVSVGFAEVKGKADTNSENYIQEPYQKENCLYYELRIQEYNHDDQGSDWDTIEHKKEYSNFEVDDGTGKLQVKPSDETTFSGSELEEEITVSEEEAPEIIKKNDNVGGLITDNDRYRIKLEKITPKEEVIVAGKIEPNNNSDYSKEGHKNLHMKDYEKSIISSITDLPFIVSNESNENELISDYKKRALISFIIGIGLLSVGLYLIFDLLV